MVRRWIQVRWDGKDFSIPIGDRHEEIFESKPGLHRTRGSYEKLVRLLVERPDLRFAQIAEMFEASMRWVAKVWDERIAPYLNISGLARLRYHTLRRMRLATLPEPLQLMAKAAKERGIAPQHRNLVQGDGKVTTSTTTLYLDGHSVHVSLARRHVAHIAESKLEENTFQGIVLVQRDLRPRFLLIPSKDIKEWLEKKGRAKNRPNFYLFFPKDPTRGSNLPWMKYETWPLPARQSAAA